MIGSRRSWTLGLLAGLLAVTMVFPSYAAKRSPIKSITFSIKAHIVPDTEFGEEEIEFETSSSRFSIDDYEILNEDFMWNEDSVPRLRVTMTADEDYYFPALSKDKIKIKGGAEFVKATRQDSNSVLLMEIRLPSLDMTLRDLENVTLSADGTASWDAIAAAGSYEVRVYRDNKAVGAAMETKTNHLNCREKMTKGNASYTVKVRPVNKHDASEKGEWIESSGIYIDESQAAQFRIILRAAQAFGYSLLITADGGTAFPRGYILQTAGMRLVISGISLMEKDICRPDGSCGMERSTTVRRMAICFQTV